MPLTFLPPHGLGDSPHQFGRGGLAEHEDLIAGIPVHMEVMELDVVDHCMGQQ